MGDQRESPVAAARRAKALKELADVEFLRAVRAAATDPDPLVRRDLDRVFATSPETLADALRRAAFVSDVVPGFHSGSPTEIALRYAAGVQSREVTIDELGRWAYAPTPRMSSADALWEPGEGTWIEVESALDDELIDRVLFEEVIARVRPDSPYA